MERRSHLKRSTRKLRGAWRAIPVGMLVAAACSSGQPKSVEQGQGEPAKVDQSCDAKAVSERVLQRLAERPFLPQTLHRLPDSLRSPEASDADQDSISLPNVDGTALPVHPAAVLRVTPNGWLLVATDRATPPGVVALSTNSPAANASYVEELRELLATNPSASLAIDSETPMWVVGLTLAVIADSGAAEVELLFEMEHPQPVSMAIPRGFGSDDGMDALGPLFADHVSICPQAVSSLDFAKLETTPSTVMQSFAKSIAGCPCTTDFALMEAVGAMVADQIAVTGVVLALTTAPDDGQPLSASAMALWSASYSSVTARKGAILAQLPKLPPPPPPGGKRR